MKKYYNIFTMLVIALVTGLSLTACSEDDYDTNQYQQGVVLNVYGPSPVMRGGTLRFLGSNLDQIASVTIPGCPAITNIEVVKSGIPSEIRVTVPKDGPVEGLVKLVTKTDQEIWTKTELRYTEPIVIEGFEPASMMPGDQVTITGDYLNLVHMIEFADGVFVSEDEFVSHDRYAIVVTVPEEAQTGKLKLYTADLTKLEVGESVDYNIMETEEALEVGTPTITKLTSPRGSVDAQGTVTAKAGETITLTGTYFNLAKAIKIGDVEVTDFNLSADGKTLTFTLPAEAPDGEILLVTKSEVEVPLGTLATVAPVVTAVAPQPVKAGAALAITGTDLDLVATVNFPDAEGAAFTVNDDATQLTVTAVPETATEGDVTLVMVNGKEVTAAFTLVKPTVTGYNVNPVSAGGALQINGTNLDLVKTITFGKGTYTVAEGDASADGTTLTVTVPMEGTTGKPVFILANKAEVEGPELKIDEAVFCYITEMPEFDDENTPEAGGTFTVPVKNADKLTNVFVNGEEVRYIYAEKNSTLTFGIPQSATAKSVLKLVSSNGEIEYNITVIPAGSITTVIFNGPFELTWNTSTQGMIPASVFDNIPEGASVTIVFDYTVTGSDAKMKVNNGSWGHVILETGLAPESETLYPFDPDATSLSIPMTESTIANLKASATDWGGILIIHGQNAIINKISLVIEIPQETVLWKGELGPTNWSGDKTIAITDEMKAELIAGRTMGIDFVCDANGGQVEICGSWWTGLQGPKDVYGTDSDGRAIMNFSGDTTNFEWPLLQSDIDILLQQGAILFVGNGGLTIKRWYVK